MRPLLSTLGNLPPGVLPEPPGGLSALSTPDSDSSTEGCMAFHSPTETGNLGIDFLSLIQMYHAPQGIRMAEILGGRNIKSQSLSDSRAKLL